MSTVLLKVMKLVAFDKISISASVLVDLCYGRIPLFTCIDLQSDPNLLHGLCPAASRHIACGNVDTVSSVT
jgi:hypothetical protein